MGNSQPTEIREVVLSGGVSDAAPSVLLLDRNLRVVALDAAFARTFGLADSVLLGQPITKCPPFDDQAASINALLAHWAGDSVLSFTLDLQLSSGRSSRLQGELCPLQTMPGDAHYAVMLLQETHAHAGGNNAIQTPSQAGVSVFSGNDKPIAAAATGALEELVRVRTLEIARQRRAVTGIRETFGLLHANRPLEDILEQILRQAKLLFGAHAMAVFYALDPAALNLDPASLIYWRSLDELPLAQEPLALALAETLARTVQQGVPTGTTGASFAGAGGSEGACWVVPVHFERNSTGAVVFLLRTADAMTEENRELAAALSDQAVLVVTSTRLQQRAQQAATLEERDRLAHELHDAVTQSIYSLSLFAEAGRRLASLGQIERVQEYLVLLGETAQQAMKQMRLMLYELRPAVLEQVGLVTALRQRLEFVERRAGIEAELDVCEVLQLSSAVEDSLYRICQEALNNALKHASAHKVIVRLTCTADQLGLEVQDDGTGFVLDEVEALGGEGLANIRERVARLNGELTITSEPEQGTRVRVMLPASYRASDEQHSSMPTA